MYERKIDDLDIVFISYDEPLKEKHWIDLVSQNPFVKRVDGVTGFDAAHKKAAEISTTDRFITIDGDTTVDPRFFDMTLRYNPVLYDKHVFSWASTNSVNGLVYGNGSIKCWPRDLALKMNSHETGVDARSQIEFCWSLSYLSMKDSYSITHPAATPYHAFRAGLREGVKMALVEGRRVPSKQLFDSVWKGNAQRLLSWCSVGADHENGLWAILGARTGLHLITDGEFDYSCISDYEWVKEYWLDTIGPMVVTPHTSHCKISGLGWNQNWLLAKIEALGQQILYATDVYIPVFSPDHSRLHKTLMQQVHSPSEKVLFGNGEF